MSPLAGLDIPVSGVLEGVADPAGLFQLTKVDLTSGAGQVDLPGVFPQIMKIAGARLSAAASVSDSPTVTTSPAAKGT